MKRKFREPCQNCRDIDELNCYRQGSFCTYFWVLSFQANLYNKRPTIDRLVMFRVRNVLSTRPHTPNLPQTPIVGSPSMIACSDCDPDIYCRLLRYVSQLDLLFFANVISPCLRSRRGLKHCAVISRDQSLVSPDARKGHVYIR